MSKEQTPIEEIRNFAMQKMKENEVAWVGLRNLHTTDWIIICKEYAEQYAQAKVLEALEREFYNYEDNNPNKGHIEYYETEVKPKYLTKD